MIRSTQKIRYNVVVCREEPNNPYCQIYPRKIYIYIYIGIYIYIYIYIGVYIYIIYIIYIRDIYNTCIYIIVRRRFVKSRNITIL